MRLGIARSSGAVNPWESVRCQHTTIRLGKSRITDFGRGRSLRIDRANAGGFAQVTPSGNSPFLGGILGPNRLNLRHNSE